MRILADQAIPLGNYTGTIKIGFGGAPLVVPDDAESCDIRIRRCTSADQNIWPSATVFLTVIPECSINGGQTWLESGRSGPAAGGITPIKGQPGTETPYMQSGGSLPPAAPGIPRLYRCTFIITGGILRTSGDVVVTP